MARRFVLVVLAVAAVLAALMGALLVWRVPVAQSLLDWAAKDLDIPGARVTVARISADRAHAIDLAAGEGAELTVDGVEVEFRPRGLAEGRVDEVVVEGLTLTLDLRQGADLLGSLQPLLERLGEGEAGDDEAEALPETLPNVQFRAGRVAAETPYGPASLAFDGTLAGGPEGGPRLQLQGELTSDMARLVAELSASGDPQREAEAEIAVTDGQVELPEALLRIGAFEGDLNVSVVAGRPSAGRGAFAAHGLAVAGTRFDDAQMTLELSRQRADLTARLASDDGSFDLALEGRAENLDALPQLRLELSSQVAQTAPIWAFSRPPFPTGGAGRLELSAVGEFADLPPLQGGDGLLAWFTQGGLSGRAAGTFSQLTLPGTEAEAAVEADVAAVWANQELSLASRQKNRATVTGFASEDLETLGLPAALADRLVGVTGGEASILLPAPAHKPSVLIWRPDEPARGAWFDGSALITAGPLTAALTGTAEAALGPAPALTRIDLREVNVTAAGIEMDGFTIEDLAVTGGLAGNPRSFEAAGDLTGRFAIADLNGLSAGRLSLDLPLAATREGRTLDLLLTEPGRLTVQDLSAADLLGAEAPVDVTLAGHNARLTLAEEGGGFALRHETRLGLGETLLRLQSEEGPGLPLEVRAPSIVLTGELSEDGRYQGEAAVRDASLALPDFGLAFEAISADLVLSDGPANAVADFEIAAVRHLAVPAAFAGLGVSGRSERRDETVDLTALVRRPDGDPLAEVSAAHDLASGSGRAEVSLTPLQFAPGGLQPGALSPLLAGLSEVHGAVEGAASLAWTGEGLAGGATFVIENLTFSGDDLAVSGLDLSLELDSLQPLASPPHQVLRADVIDVGVPLTDFEARFRLPLEAPGQIFVEQASFATIDSHFALSDTWLDPAGDRLETLLQVDQLDMAVLFDLLAIDGLSGSGALTGTIPIRRDGGLVTIQDARLEAQAPGMLRFRSDAAQRALKAGGDHVDLVVRALQDFHFQTLTLTGDLDRGGEAQLRLEILGHNPAVLEGHPFQFNINLTANPTPILKAMLRSRTWIGKIMERARRLSQ